MDKSKVWMVFLVVAVAAIFGLFSYQLIGQRDTERRIRIQKESDLSNRMIELAEKEAALSALSKEKADIEERLGERIAKLEAASKEYEDGLRGNEERISSLSTENEVLRKELSGKEKEISDLKRRIRTLETDKDDLLESLQKASEAAKKPADPDAEADAADAPGGTQIIPDIDAVKLGEIVIQKSTGRAAEVRHVDKTYGFIIIEAGWYDGMRENTLLNILRGKKVIGKAVIRKVRDDISAAVLLPEWSHGEVRPGDLVTRY